MANCIYCGQQISDGETTCPYCGAVQGEQPVMSVQQDYGQQMMNPQMGYDGQDMQQGYGQQMMNPQMGYDGQNVQQNYGQPQPDAKKHKNGKKVGIIVGVSVALVIAALAVVFVVMFAGPGAPTQAAAVKSYIKAIIKQNEDDYLDACYTKQLLKGIQKENGSSNDDFEDEIEQMMQEDDYSDKDAVRKIKIIDEEKKDSFDVEELEGKINNEYNIKIKIEEIVFIEYECELKEGDEWKKDSNTITLYKIKGKWFVMEDSLMYVVYNGFYVISEISSLGMTFPADEFENFSGQKVDMSLTIKGNNCIVETAGGRGNAKITFDGADVTIEAKNGTFTGRYDSSEETITLTVQEVDLVFKKK
ncbi:MAG: hypothetical protein NC240_04265 [Clostridium sp.]|nr:hypothetical protein [Clostridium sp.]